MFHKKEIELYHSITAPQSLKNRVVGMEQKPVLRPWYARHSALVTACASLIFILSAVLLFSQSSPDTMLLAGGQELGGMPVELSYNSPYAKANNPNMDDNYFSTLLEIDVSGNTIITVSGGTIYDTENSNYAGKSITVTKDTNFCWTLDDKAGYDPYYLTVATQKMTYTYILEENKKNGIWTISQQ